MPSVTATRAQLAITGAAAFTIPYRVEASPAALRLVGGTATVGPGTGTDLDVTTPELDRLTRFDELLDDPRFRNVGPSTRLQLIWQRTMEAIETAFEALSTQVNDNTVLLAQIQQAQELAQTANDTAQAQAQADALAKSYVSPLDIISANSSGTVTITAHTRIYGDGTSVAVDGGSVSGFVPGDYVQVYYDDAAREGGAVSYQGTTSVIAQEGARHIVGGVTIPAVGVPPTTGLPPFPPGYIPPQDELPEFPA